MRFGQTTGRSHRQQALVPDRALTFPLPGKQAIPEKTCVELAPKKKAQRAPGHEISLGRSLRGTTRHQTGARGGYN
jgi:hypothetical protein